MFQYFAYIFFDVKNTFLFKCIYFLEKIGKAIVLWINIHGGFNIPFLYLFKKDYTLYNSDGIWRIRTKSDYDTLISPLFEPELREAFTLSEGGIFLDIGSHVGKWSVFVAKQNKNNRVYAFDINPYTFSYLKENIVLNQLESQIIPVNEGLSNIEGSFEFSYDTINTGTSTLDTSRQGEHIQKIPVHVQSFDALMHNLQIDMTQIRLIKIDVEGHEQEVFEGMRGFLSSDIQKLNIICEIHDTSPYKDKIIQTLKEYGFGLKFIGANRIDHIFYKL